MLIATPHPDVQPTSPPDWIPINDALKNLKVRKRILKRDWRSEVAAVDGAWLVWYDFNDDDELHIGLGLVQHAANEKEVRKQNQVTVRPFKSPKTTVIIPMILGAVDIPDKERGIWSVLDGLDAERAGGMLKGDKWWNIGSGEHGAPTTFFNPARWREDMERRKAKPCLTRTIG